jgi:hypothetical protein
MFKIIIAGSRTFNDYDMLCQKVDKILHHHPIVEIVSGCCKGADLLGERYAKERVHLLNHFPADWDKYGKVAGFRRNREMALYADALIAFWDGKSRGTQCMIEFAKERNLLIRVIRF